MAMGSSLRVVDGRKKAPHVCVYDPYLMEYLKNSGDMEYLRRLVPQLEGHSTATIVFASSRFPLYMSWVYRVTRFTNAVVSLVTANAYISTLGGGYFLCRHLNQAKLMAQLQICVSQGLQDPILTRLCSKCRINLAYGAMAQGKFKRAQRIITDETKRAHILRSEEMHSVCHAAQVYLDKTWDLHQSILVHEPTDTTRVVDEYYRQRVVRKSR